MGSDGNALLLDRTRPSSIRTRRTAGRRPSTAPVDALVGRLWTALSARRPNVSSIAALRGGGGPYAAAKAAPIGWTYQLAAVLGPEGITANVVAPGYVEDTEFFGDTMTEERRRRLISQTVAGRAGRPEDVAAAVRYLASPEALAPAILAVAAQPAEPSAR